MFAIEGKSKGDIFILTIFCYFEINSLVFWNEAYLESQTNYYLAIIYNLYEMKLKCINNLYMNASYKLYIKLF